MFLTAVHFIIYFCYQDSIASFQFSSIDQNFLFWGSDQHIKTALNKNDQQHTTVNSCGQSHNWAVKIPVITPLLHSLQKLGFFLKYCIYQYIIDSWNGLGSSSSNPFHRQGHLTLDQVAPSPIQPSLEQCQGWGSLNFSGQPVPLVFY